MKTFDVNQFTIDSLKLHSSELRRAVWEHSTPKNVAIGVGSLSAGFLLYKTIKLYILRRKYRHIPGPPTRGILGFFLGNIPEINAYVKTELVFPGLLLKWHETYGDVFKFQMFGQIIISTTDKDATKEILITKNFPKEKDVFDRIGLPGGYRFMGNGLVTETDNNAWKHRRAIFNPGFHRHVLITFVGHFNQIVNNLSDKFRSLADNKTMISLMNELNRATLDAIAIIAFGMNTDSISNSDSKLNAYLAGTLGICFKNLINPYYKYFPSNFGEMQDLSNMVRHIREIGKYQILERIKSHNNDETQDNILSSILTTNKQGEIDFDIMVDDFVTFFVAGQETTANALSFCFYELFKNPDVIKTAREEIDRVLGERTEVTFQDVNELKYCSAIFKEALRLYPPAPQVFRITPEDFEVQGLMIPKQTSIWLSPYVSGRYSKNYKNPLEFKPERFLKSSQNTDGTSDNYVYFPFSLGPRNCIGQNFAQIEGVIVLAKLIQKFDFRLDPSQSMAVEQNLTLRPKDGLRCFVSLRN